MPPNLMLLGHAWPPDPNLLSLPCLPNLSANKKNKNKLKNKLLLERIFVNKGLLFVVCLILWSNLGLDMF